MDFTYDSEQNDLREAVAVLLARAYGDSEVRRKVTKTDPGFDEKVWTQLAEMGLLGLPFAEEHGGMGAGPVEVAIVASMNGSGAMTRPISSATIATSIGPAPMPPCSSAKGRPSRPISDSRDQVFSSKPGSVAATLRRASLSE